MHNHISKTLGRIIGSLYFIFWLDIYLTTTAQAYIDPAATAMLSSIIAGIFISAGVLFGVYRRRIMLFFKNMSVKRTRRKIENEQKKTESKKDAAN